MSTENKTTAASPARKSKRITRGFQLVFPTTPFTLRTLRKQKHYDVKYITLYKRLQVALKNKTVVPTGELKAPTITRKGRYEKLYVAAKTAKASAPAETAPVATPVAAAEVPVTA
jgi:hypothetical protein